MGSSDDNKRLIHFEERSDPVMSSLGNISENPHVGCSLSTSVTRSDSVQLAPQQEVITYFAVRRSGRDVSRTD
jgi:hypothetical protein